MHTSRSTAKLHRRHSVPPDRSSPRWSDRLLLLYMNNGFLPLCLCLAHPQIENLAFLPKLLRMAHEVVLKLGTRRPLYPSLLVSIVSNTLTSSWPSRMLHEFVLRSGFLALAPLVIAVLMMFEVSVPTVVP